MASKLEEIDESQLSGENGEVYLFQWLSAAENKLRDTTTDYPNQPDFEAALIKIVQSTPPYPSPGRVFRNLACRCLIHLHTRTETRNLFDTLQKFMVIITDSKSQNRDMNKVAAFYCIGELMAAFGNKFMSFMAEITSAALKAFKSSSAPILRYHALVALCKSLTTAGKAITEPTSKDIIKSTRHGLSDKVLAVQRAAADVLRAIYSPKQHTLLPSDIESIMAICSKSMESADQVTRHSLAQLVGHVLAATQSEVNVDSSDTSSKTKIETDESAEHTVPPAQQRTANYSVAEMLEQISIQFNKPNVSRKARIGIFNFYSCLLTELGPSFVQKNYMNIVNHLMTEILSNSKNSGTRHERLLVRNLIGLLLRDLIGVRMLSEQGQIEAIQDLSKSYLKRWPAMLPGQVSPTPLLLTVILAEVACLMQQLGNAPSPVQDAVSDPLVTLLGHPSHTVRVNAAWALRCFCHSTPLRLPKIILVVVEMLQRDIGLLASPTASGEVKFRALGHAYGLSALISIIPERPLYVSYDISAKVLDIAVQLLKCAAEHDTSVASVEVEIAWMLMAALMSLGPNFVRPHLPQMLVLWRNALPKPTSKDAVNTRSNVEWMFLLHVRESALGAILCFLKHNLSALVTLDVGRRIATVLSNALLFANNFVVQDLGDPSDSTASLVSKGLSLRSHEALLRRRVYQCFAALGFASIPKSAQSTLLQSTTSFFAGPDTYSGSSVQAAIASSSGTFTSVWHCLDGHAYGVTSLDISNQELSSTDAIVPVRQLNRDAIEMSLDALLRRPVLGALEHDPLSVCDFRSLGADHRPPESAPPSTSVVDTAIDLFAQLLPLQDLASASLTISQLLEHVNSVKSDRNVGRKAAVSINCATAIVLSLRYATSRHTRQSRESLGDSQVATPISSFLMNALCDGDPVLRLAGSEAIGRLASLADTSFLASQTKFLVDQVVNNRDPYCRAGCALAFGAIYGHVGGLVAGPLLKTTVNVLMSLSGDPHPVVHFWALNALSQVINAASLAYAPFVPSTLGLLLKVYTLESHEVEGGVVSNANASGDFPSYPVICQIIDAVITVLGPDIRESPRARTLVLSLIREFSLEEDESICVEAIYCTQHFLMFAPEHLQLPALVGRFREYLSSPRRLVKSASINALYQLVQKDALSMSRLGGDQLVEDLFGMLDDDSSVEGVRNVISSWLRQTVIHNPSAWIDLCQRIMSRTTASQQLTDASNNQASLRDDEGESLNSSQGAISGKSRLTSRWRTQAFALQCLHNICSVIFQSGRREHYDVPFAKKAGILIPGLLVSRVSDLIKMAFTASTAYVTDIRLEGLTLLNDVIQTFATAPDPAYEGGLLLEQHQAPITAALTPAFSADSTPEILASAIRVCAAFVGSGVVKDVSRMGRILKLLTNALEQSSELGMFSLGEAQHLSPNASSMLRISTLSAWAQLETASVRQQYLNAVVNPHRKMLASLWVASLRDYASICVDSEFLQDSSSIALESSHLNLGKEVLLPYYAEAWPGILQAIASLIASGNPGIVLAMDGIKEGSDVLRPAASGGRQEPCAMFFVIFGLVYEALANSTIESTTSTLTRQPITIAALQSLKFLIKPEFSGQSLQETVIFDELTNLCYRMVMTEPASIQIHLIEAMVTLATTQVYPGSSTKTNLAQTYCLKICAYILRHSISSNHEPAIVGDPADRIEMIIAALKAFVKIACLQTSSQREDIRAVAIFLYSELLKDETSEIDLVAPTLPALKSLLELPFTNEDSSSEEKFTQSLHGLLSTCLVNLDVMRGRQGPICVKIVKNNLLTAVVVLTVSPPSVKVARNAVERCCFMIASYLLDSDESVLTAAHCAKTLILASSSGSVVLHYCAKTLVPAMIEYILKMVPCVVDGTTSDFHTSAIGEIWKALSTLFTYMPETHGERMLGVLLPIIALLLDSPLPASLNAQVVTHLLMLATATPLLFKEAAKKLDPTMHKLLQQSVQRAVGNVTVTNTSGTIKPQISLRSF